MKTWSSWRRTLIAGQADDALDEVDGGVGRVMEDDDVAAAELAGGEGKVVEGGGLLVDEKEVADEESGDHGGRRDAEGLDGEGDDEDGDDDDGEEGLDGGEEAVMRVVVGLVSHGCGSCGEMDEVLEGELGGALLGLFFGGAVGFGDGGLGAVGGFDGDGDAEAALVIGPGLLEEVDSGAAGRWPGGAPGARF